MIDVTVKGPAGRDVYVNGVFSHSYGKVPIRILTLAAGSHDFETLAKDGNDWIIDFAATLDDAVDESTRIVVLLPVVPPRKLLP